MPISGKGWELHLNRLGIHVSGSRQRTYGEYQIYHDGKPVPTLMGHMCECVGPGDNKTAGNAQRVEQGRYPLWTQFGRYRTIDYSTNLHVPADPPMPAIRLAGTGNRDGILIHPGHPPALYLSSIGCLNPTNSLEPEETMNFWDSRMRVIQMIDDLRSFAPNAFQHDGMTRIPDAWAVIDGEPMEKLAGQPASLPRPHLG